MLSTKKRMQGVVVAVASLVSFWAALPALGHEERLAGKYKFVVGFLGEPTFRGFPNAIDMFITRASDDQPISVKDGTV